MHCKSQQSGFALLVFVIALLGASGFALSGYLQKVQKEVEANKTHKNKIVLQQAKDALLQFAYNYPELNGSGPGRLPCVDIDNDGDSDTGFGACTQIGRFPYKNTLLGTEKLMDASGETLWYAVSDNFATNVSGGNIVNSDSFGNITIKDQSGTLIYDGSVTDPIYGVAAVIVAPGPVTERSGVIQDRSGGNVTVASQYLDLLGTQDNATLTFGDNDDGFIMGPIGKNEKTVTINDQIMIVTAQEVIEMAEKATLQAYQKSIENYQRELWGLTTSNYRYPWLNAYTDITNLNIYNVPTGENVGRIPINIPFQDDDSHQVVSDLQIDFDIDANLIDSNDGNDPAYLNNFLNGLQTQTVTGSTYSFSKTAFAGAPDIKTDDLGMFVSQSGGAITFTETLYFWDGCATCTDMSSAAIAENGWELCDSPATSEQDCAMASGAFIPFTAWTAHDDIKIRLVDITWTIDPEFRLGLDFSINPTFSSTNPPAAGNHANYIASINNVITNLQIDTDGSVADTHDFISAEVTNCEQDDFVGDNYNLPSASPDTGSVYCMNNDGSNPNYNMTYDSYHDDTKEIVYPLAVSAAPVINQFDMHLDYFPQVPTWVMDNNWNDSIMLAYANNYEPGGSGANCTPGTDCLDPMLNISGKDNNKKSLIVIAGDIPADSTDLEGIFDGENNAPDEHRNSTLNTIFDFKPANGDDHILILDEI